MLTSTFIHTPGIGAATELKIWASGVTTWQDFLHDHSCLPLSRKKKDCICAHLVDSEQALAKRDYHFFANCMANRDQWRTFPDFSHSVAYLDIETTGMGDNAIVTMVGVYDGEGYRSYIHGINLQQFPEDIQQYSLLVTYFGTGFDLPFLRRYFPYLHFDQLHIDLCPLLRRLGYKGGLKRVEEQLGIIRSDDIKGLNGYDAIRLWWEYVRGSDRSLELLVQYNRDDVVNLQTLMHYAYKTSAEGLMSHIKCSL